MKLNNDTLNKLKKDFKDVDLEDINVKIISISPPTIDNRDEEEKEYIDVESISIDIDNNKHDNELYNDDLEDITIPIDKNDSVDINLSPTNKILEIVTYEELDKMIKTDCLNLKELELEITILNSKEEDLVSLKQIKDLEKELDKLIEKFQKLTKTYDNIYENIDYKYIREISEDYFKYLIDDYNSFLDKDLINNTISKELIDEYISIVNAIIDIENKKDKLKIKINEKKTKFNIRDKEFDKIKDEHSKIDKITDNIESINKDFDKSLNNIKDLLKNNIDIQKNIEYQKKLSLNIGNAIKGSILIGSSKLFPPTKKGNMFRIAFMIIGISKLSNLIKEEKKEKITYKIDINNYEKEISNNILNVNNVIDDIENAFIDIDYIRKTLKKDFKDFIDIIPEYKELIKNINKLEKELDIQKDIAKNYSNEFKKSLQENNEKIKRLDKYE